MNDTADPTELFDGPISVTFALIALCVAISLIGFWALRKERYRDAFRFVPSQAARGRGLVGALLSHFAHGDLGHLFINMLVLFLFGPRVERALGHLPFLLLYLVSGLVGTLAIFLFRRKNPRYAALGASGSIAGVVFASVVIAPTSRIFLLILPIPIPAPVFALLYLVVSSLQMGGGDGIAHEAHLGGALAGLALAGVLYGPGFDPLIRAVTQLLP
jgi:membrane associated rhomboid family serine protease